MNENEDIKRKIRDKRNKKKKRNRIIILGVLIVLAIAIAVPVWYYYYIRKQVYVESKPTTPKTENKVDYTEVEGITNVLLIGTDEELWMNRQDQIL